jgi:hypothetical protein
MRCKQICQFLPHGFKQVDAHETVRQAQAVLGTHAAVEELVRACLKKGA